ncbi:MAG: hypothetical protein IPJ76_02380 [Flavobacteriales bacterium]|nr:MAG: hypothetical protein IPJ76_02380 [Flavobacteriales bacterium]
MRTTILILLSLHLTSHLCAQGDKGLLTLQLTSDPLNWYRQSTWNAQAGIGTRRWAVQAELDVQYTRYADDMYLVDYTRWGQAYTGRVKFPVRTSRKSGRGSVVCYDWSRSQRAKPARARPCFAMAAVFGAGYRSERFTHTMVPMEHADPVFKQRTFFVKNNGPVVQAVLALRLYWLAAEVGGQAFMGFPKYEGAMNPYGDALYTSTLPFKYRFELTPIVRIGINVPLIRTKTQLN